MELEKLKDGVGRGHRYMENEMNILAIVEV
jgi:hypothetical protein